MIGKHGELGDRGTQVQGIHRDLVIGGHRFKGDIGSKVSSHPRIKGSSHHPVHFKSFL